MPLHLDSIISEKQDEVLKWLLQERAPNCEDIFADTTKRFLHFSEPLVDVSLRKPIGATVFTFKINDEKKTLELLDADIVLKNPSNTKVNFLKRLPQSSEANEYYDADTEFGGKFQLETVNRYLLDESPEGKEYAVNLSAFPFQLSVYDTMKDLNSALGFANPVKVGQTDMEVDGYGEDFVAPGSFINLLSGKPDSDETFSFVIGTIAEMQKCSVELAGELYSFFVAQIRSGMGNLPTLINPDRYDVSDLAPGKIVAMFADIKADFKLTDKYQKRVKIQRKKNRVLEWFKGLLR